MILFFKMRNLFSTFTKNHSIIKSQDKTLETDKRIQLQEYFKGVPNMWISVNCLLGK